MGPGLNGVAGAKIASRPGFNYSAALRKKTGVWSDAQLNAWLAGPPRFAPGTKMMVAVTNPADRAALVAHLKSLK
jgi:cytochrome c